MEPEEALHFHILRRKKEGVEDWIDRSVEKIGAVPTLNTVLLPAMKEVGDKFGAGELILPFVLQSAEVMKRAVAQLEHYLDKVEGYTKGTVVIATVFGDVHDIGKSLVNTILTNNGYTVVDLGKQVPISTILDAAVEHKATAIGLSALLVSTSKQMPACIQELHQRGLEFPVLIGGAAINRNFGLRILYPRGTESDEVYEPGVFYCKDAFEGLAKMDQLIDAEAREALVAKTREAAREAARAARGAPTTTRRRPTDASVRSAAATDNPVPEPPFWGAREIEVDAGRGLPPPRHPRAVQAALGRARRQGRGLDSGSCARTSSPGWSGCGASRTTCAPGRCSATSPATADGNELIVWDPEAPRAQRELERLVFPRQPSHDRICLADFYRPLDSGETDVVALQAVTAGEEVTELMAKLEADGEFAEQLFVHGLGVQTRRGHGRVAARPRALASSGIAPTQGRRYSWGYPACPEQSEHEKVFRLLDAPSIGLRLSGGYAVEPEQSTLAIVAHHPQAVYFGMKSGSLPKDEQQAADELIAGTEKDPARLGRCPTRIPPPARTSPRWPGRRRAPRHPGPRRRRPPNRHPGPLSR